MILGEFQSPRERLQRLQSIVEKEKQRKILPKLRSRSFGATTPPKLGAQLPGFAPRGQGIAIQEPSPTEVAQIKPERQRFDENQFVRKAIVETVPRAARPDFQEFTPQEARTLLDTAVPRFGPIGTPTRSAWEDYFRTLSEGSPGAPHGEPPFPGVVGKIPGFRTPAELASTVGTAGLGELPIAAKVGGLALGSLGAFGGGEAAAQIKPEYRPYGEIGGGLLGAVAGSVAGPKVAAGVNRGLAESGGVSGLGQRLATEEVGGTKLPGKEPIVPPEGEIVPPKPEEIWQTAVNKLTTGFKASRKGLRESEAVRIGERRERIALYQDIRDKALAEGKSPQEALAEARAGLKGEYYKFTAPEFGLTGPENEAIWQRAATYDYGKRPFQQVTVATALTRIANGEPLRRFEIKALGEIYGDEFAKVLTKARSSKSAWDQLVDVLTIPQTVLSSFDVSYPFRQGIKVSVRHAKEFYGNIPGMLKAFAKQDVAEGIDGSIRSDPLPVTISLRDGARASTWGEIAEDIGILRPLPGAETGIREAEESVLSQLAQKIPGIKQSGRAFVTYGNKLRSDIGKYWIQSWQKAGLEITEKDLRDLGNVLNRLTGRGTLGDNVIADSLQALGWAPKYRISGPQAVLQMFNFGNPKIQRIAIENVLSFLGAGIATLTALKLSGAADVEVDPRSTDFGKVRVGNTRFNFFGSDQVLFRTVAQMATGEKKLDTGEVVGYDPRVALLRYLRSGSAPHTTLATDILTGRNYPGQKMKLDFETLKRELPQRLFPLVAQDVYNIWNQDGPLMALAAAPLSALGLTVGSYQPSTSSQLRTRFQEKYGHSYNPESPADRQLIDQDEELKAIQEEGRGSALERGYGTESASIREALRGQEEDQGIVRLAEQINSGNKEAAANWADAAADYASFKAGAWATYFAQNPKETKTEIGKLVEEYLTLNPKDPKYTDENGVTDWDAFTADKDAVKQKMVARGYKADAETVDERDRYQNETANKIDKQFQKARELRKQYYEMPRWRSQVTHQDEIEEIHKGIEELRLELADKGYANIPAASIYREYFKDHPEYSDEIKRYAYALRSGTAVSERYRNPEKDNFLIQNREALQDFFPDLFTTRVRAEAAQESRPPAGRFIRLSEAGAR